jgi:hypothetical protein
LQSDQHRVLRAARALDVVVLVDDSLSMQDEQESLARNFPAFVAELRRIGGGLPDLRLAVITSDLGAGGHACGNTGQRFGDGGRSRTTDRAGRSCGLPDGATYITATQGGSRTNLGPDFSLEQAFACLAKRGTGGCGFEHQLASLRLALRPDPAINPQNIGFLRPDAVLAIILLTDEDDCSAAPDDAAFFEDQPARAGEHESLRCATEGHVCGGRNVTGSGLRVPLATCGARADGRLLSISALAKELAALKPDRPDLLMLSAIAGWSQPGDPVPGDDEATSTYEILRRDGRWDLAPACALARSGGAAPAQRIRELVRSFGENGSLHPICQPELAGSLKRIGELVAAAVNVTCIDDPLADTDPKRPGVQPDCALSERPAERGGRGLERLVPACRPGGPRPCVRIEPEASCKGSAFRYEVDRAGGPPPGDVEQVLRCAACASKCAR